MVTQGLIYSGCNSVRSNFWVLGSREQGAGDRQEVRGKRQEARGKSDAVISAALYTLFSLKKTNFIHHYNKW